MLGKEHIDVNEVPAGDIAAVAKLSDTATGDTLAPKGAPITVPALELPDPVLSIAISPKSKGDDDKLMTALRRLQEEDPTLRVRRDDESHQTLLSGMGETHLLIVTERLHRKFGVDVETAPVQVPYRETITSRAEAVGRYKKQTGGHGQFGVAELRLTPAERGGGFTFVDEIVGGAIPRQFIPAVEKGVAETMQQGGQFGYPVVDVTVTCFDGKYHAVDSSEMSFKMAGSLGFRDALAKASPGAARADLLDRGHRPEHVPRRRDGRSQRATRTSPGHRTARVRRARHSRAGPDLGDPALRDRPALDHGRLGPVPRRARPLRPPADAPLRQGGRQG